MLDAFLKCVFGTVSLILYVNLSSVLILHNIYSEIRKKKKTDIFLIPNKINKMYIKSNKICKLSFKSLLHAFNLSQN